ncbi:TadE family protein [Methylocapsa sp. S129]|uniref:TadE family protein n=1 Tax=Methylocapsa sp. S129 TaxID=1641869 RepID=UPI00131CDD04|nr:TadE/TadG family type IV pilus assembly protein [Methylocapsa sp. S129]
MPHAPSKFWTSKRAAAASEFALVLPIILFMFAAIVEFGRIFQVYVATNRLATQFAIAWADCATACQTELNEYSSSYTIANIAPQLTTTSPPLTLTMFEVTMSGTTPTVVYSYPASATMTAAQTTVAQANFSSGQTGVIVTASYAHTLDFFNSLMAPILGPYLNPTYTVAQLKNYT